MMIEQFLTDHSRVMKLFDSESGVSNFFKKYDDCLNNSKQTMLDKLEAKQQKVVHNKEKYRLYKKKMLDLEETSHKSEIQMENFRRDFVHVNEKMEKLKNVIEVTKKENSELSVKNHEIERDIEEKINEIKIEWSALVRAYNVYKKFLNIHVKLDKDGDLDLVQVTFFHKENPDKDNFFVTLVHQDEKWTIVKIVPELSEEDRQQLRDFPNKMEDCSVIALVTQLRKIFVKYKNLN